MPITFTAGLEPTFPAGSFGSEKTHVKQLGVELIAGDAFKNPLASALTTMLARVDTVKASLVTDKGVSDSESATMQGYVSGTLPTGFSNASYDDADMTSIANAAIAYATANTALQNQLTTFKNYFTVADLDNFKLHNELLCGLDNAPPAGIEKPNLVALMGLCRSITDMENNHGVAFTNYLTGLFGTLFTGDTTIANAQTHLNTNPIPTTYDSLDIVTAVNANPFSTTPAALVSAIGALSGVMNTYGTAVETHQGHFTTHITTDMAFYNTLIDKGKAYVQAYQVSGHIQDPYYRFMYTDVFGHDDIQQTITDLANGDIT
tara:strand:- start:161 stop:1117 length:957 start_codon:yes stop_codon:yes gene_type:complete